MAKKRRGRPRKVKAPKAVRVGQPKRTSELTGDDFPFVVDYNAKDGRFQLWATGKA